MLPLSANIAEITESQLEGLIQNKVAEDKFIEYKRDLPGSTDGVKKEFLFDVSSFANASGGYLLYGIGEKNGYPLSPMGVSVSDPDTEVRKWDSLIGSSINPRIPGTALRFVPVTGDKQVLVIHIPKSWNPPHMVTFKGTNKFYTRTSAGKQPLDVDELRSLFLASATLTEQIHKFRTERLSQIIADDTPIALDPTPKLILHLVPFQSFTPGNRIDLAAATALPAGLLYPLGAIAHDSRLNLDGILTNSPGNQGAAGGYLQLHQTGIIETVSATILWANLPLKHIPSNQLEWQLIGSVPRYLKALRTLQLNPPFVLALSLVGVKDYQMAIGALHVGAKKIDRDVLLIPEILLQRFECGPTDLKPLFDLVWNASGVLRSPFFNSKGEYEPDNPRLPVD